jgi:hypothetical protein
MDSDPAAACSGGVAAAEGTASAAQRDVARAACAPDRYALRQFDRSGSFTSLGTAAGDIELADRLRAARGYGGGGGGCGDGDSTTSSASSDSSLAPADGDAAARGGEARAEGEGWASFEIGEPSTEAAFVRSALAKKVGGGGAGEGWAASLPSRGAGPLDRAVSGCTGAARATPVCGGRLRGPLPAPAAGSGRQGEVAKLQPRRGRLEAAGALEVPPTPRRAAPRPAAPRPPADRGVRAPPVHC